jgi:phosphate:Na+ symporter
MDPIFLIASGVALILFGVRFLRKGLVRWMGKGLDAKLEGWTGSSLGAAISGFLFGTFAPSSTTQSILAVNLLKNRKISPSSVLSFLLWANAGITVTVQLISLKVSTYYPILLVLGVLGFQFSKRPLPRAIGQCLVAFGLIFMAMVTISTSASALTSEGDLAEVIKISARHPWVMLFCAAICTVVLQSSMAVMGIMFALAPSGLIPLEGLLSSVLGTNIGIGLTTLLAGWSEPRNRILGISSLLIKISVVGILAYFIPVIVLLFESWSLSPVTSGALLHSVVSFTGALVGTFSSPWLGAWFRHADQSETATSAIGSSLDPSLLTDPRLALACASREAVKLGDRVVLMYRQSWEAVDLMSLDLSRLASGNLAEITKMEEEINSYVGSLDWSTLSRSQRDLAFGIMNYASQLDGIADTVSKSVIPLVSRRASGFFQPSPEEAADLAKIREMVLRRLDASTAVLASRDPALASSFLSEGEALKKFTISVLKNTYRKMGFGHDHALTSMYLDVIRALRRISGQLNTIGHTFSPSALQEADSQHHDDATA